MGLSVFYYLPLMHLPLEPGLPAVGLAHHLKGEVKTFTVESIILTLCNDMSEQISKNVLYIQYCIYVQTIKNVYQCMVQYHFSEN